MLQTIINQSDCQALTTLLKQGASNSALYSTLSDAERLTDINADTRCAMPPGYRLIRADRGVCASNDGFEVALLNDLEFSVAYYNKVEASVIPESDPRAAAHCFTWRSPDARHAAVVREAARSVLFNYILERYDVVLSDRHEFGEGRFFWQRQISLAIAHGLCVSYPITAGQLQPIPTQEALNKLVDRLWTEAHEQTEHLVLISQTDRSDENLGLPTERDSQRAEALRFSVRRWRY